MVNNWKIRDVHIHETHMYSKTLVHQTYKITRFHSDNDTSYVFWGSLQIYPCQSSHCSRNVTNDWKDQKYTCRVHVFPKTFVYKNDYKIISTTLMPNASYRLSRVKSAKSTSDDPSWLEKCHVTWRTIKTIGSTHIYVQNIYFTPVRVSKCMLREIIRKGLRWPTSNAACRPSKVKFMKSTRNNLSRSEKCNVT